MDGREKARERTAQPGSSDANMDEGKKMRDADELVYATGVWRGGQWME